jgi:ParB family chromosome partitioning protein
MVGGGNRKGDGRRLRHQDKPEFERLEAEKLHDGAVTALLFEPEELRFLSACADRKLLSTHACGRLEPEDKGRENYHTDLLTAMLLSPVGDRLLTGGRDAVLKTWTRVGGVKPAKHDDGVVKVVALAVVTAHTQPRLAACSDDNATRFFDLDPEGRFGPLAAKVYGAVDRAKSELSQNDPRRVKVLKELATWKDAASLDLIAAQLDKDADHQFRHLAAQTLAASPNPRTVGLLEGAVNHQDEKVRVTAFQGLQKHLGPADPRPIDAALKTGKPDVGALAVKALEPLAATDDQALARLADALDHAAWDVRKAALAALAGVFAADPPRAGWSPWGRSSVTTGGRNGLGAAERPMVPVPQPAAERPAGQGVPGRPGGLRVGHGLGVGPGPAARGQGSEAVPQSGSRVPGGD